MAELRLPSEKNELTLRVGGVRSRESGRSLVVAGKRFSPEHIRHGRSHDDFRLDISYFVLQRVAGSITTTKV